MEEMKKLVAICVVLLFAVPAFAADWAFYGSQRMGTWYVDRDNGDVQVNGKSDDQATQWFFQGNSRLGAKVKADKVTGQIELALTATNGGDGGDGTVNTRRAYGVWKISDAMSLKVGKDYSPVTDFISNQWFAADNDMLGEGNFYGRRPAMLQLNLGGFEIAALTPTYGGDVNTGSNTAANGINGAVGGDPDSYIPRFEAAYQLKLGAGYIRPFAGLQYYTNTQTGIAGSNVTDDIDVLSWVAGISSNWNIGAFSIGGQVSYGANEGAVQGWSTGSNNRVSSQPYLKLDGDDINDTYTLQACLVAALKFTDTLRFEAGVGYRMDNADGAGPTPTGSPLNGNKDEVIVYYLQALITMAPGVYLAPEVGYYDYMDNTAGDDQGWQWYAGAKWQIEF
jgi:hypothetical protein